MQTGSALVPTMTDAERVARVVARAGAGGVVLFGSVARDEAHRRSDIDLLVIYDDVDYSTRDKLTAQLSHLARSAVDWPVDIYVTDRPEWRMRTRQVCTSFERRVERQGVVLLDNRTGEVNWEKKMVKPTNDYEEAVERLSDIAKNLYNLNSSLTPSFFQRQMLAEGEEMMAFAEYEQRLVSGCAAGQLTVETALKSLIHLASQPTEQPWGHDLTKLLPQLTVAHKIEIEARLAPVGVEKFASWQQKARYEKAARGSMVTATPELSRAITKATCSVAAYTVDQFDQDLPSIHQIRRQIAFIEQVLSERDLYTGQTRK